MRNRSESPRITSRGGSTIVSGGTSAPVHAPTGCRIARHPSGELRRAPPSSTSASIALTTAPALVITAPRSIAGASEPPCRSSAAPSAPAARLPNAP